MKEFLLDANVLVRFLVQDDPKQGQQRRHCLRGPNAAKSHST